MFVTRRDTVEKKQLSDENGKASGQVILAVFDNCLINFKTSYEGIRDNGDGSRAYLFINWLVAFIDKTDVLQDYDPTAANGKPSLPPLLPLTN
jgi:hypothetical protein